MAERLSDEELKRLATWLEHTSDHWADRLGRRAITELRELRKERLDAGMLIRRLIYKLSKRKATDGDQVLIDQTQGWLNRKGLQGSILRDE